MVQAVVVQQVAQRRPTHQLLLALALRRQQVEGGIRHPQAVEQGVSSRTDSSSVFARRLILATTTTPSTNGAVVVQRMQRICISQYLQLWHSQMHSLRCHPERCATALS